MRIFLSSFLCILAFSWTAFAQQAPHELLETPPEPVQMQAIAPLPATTPPSVQENTPLAYTPSLDFLLSLLNSAIPNTTLKSLVVELLASPAGTSQATWLERRADSLVALGQEAKLRQWLATIPATQATPHLKNLPVEIELARGNVDSICQQSQKENHASTDMFWQQINILCLAKNGKSDDAILALEIMNESGGVTPFFQEAIIHINQKAIPIKNIPSPLSLFDFAVLRMAGETDRLKEKFDTLPAFAIKFLSEDASIDVKLRERATLKAQQLGLIETKTEPKPGEQPFARNVAGEVVSLVKILEAGNAPNPADNAVIARLDVKNASVNDNRRIEKLLALMELFGYTVPKETWITLTHTKNRFDGDSPPAFLLTLLEQALTEHHKAEVIVCAALLFNGNESDKVSDLVLIPVVRAIKAIGLEKEARAVAFSAVHNYQ